MPASSLQQAKRSFVTVLLTIAAIYSVRLTITRESSDEDCTKAFKRVSLKAHPNKGGLLAHSQALNAANETWDKARRNKTVAQSQANSLRKVCRAAVEKKGAATGY